MVERFLCLPRSLSAFRHGYCPKDDVVAERTGGTEFFSGTSGMMIDGAGKAAAYEGVDGSGLSGRWGAMKSCL